MSAGQAAALGDSALENPGTSLGSTRRPISFSIAASSGRSSLQTSEMASPVDPARPVPLLAMGLQFIGGRSFAKDAFGLKFSAR